MDSEKTLSTLTPEDTINRIVSADQNAGKLLSSIGMKPEQFRDQTLRSACQQLQWNEEELLSWIKKQRVETECNEPEPEVTENEDDIIALSNRILGVIQPCIRRRLSEIARDLPRVQIVHGNQYTQLKNIERHLKRLDETVDRYLLLEINTLIPLAKELSQQDQSIQYGKAKNLKRAMALLEDDREKIMKEMEMIRNFSNGFQHPAGACTTYRIMNENMADLDSQLAKYFALQVNQFLPIIENRLQST